MSRKLYNFTPELDEKLKELYPVTRAVDIAKDFGFSTRAIYNRAFELGLKKDKEVMRKWSRESLQREDHPARSFWIKKGTKPSNTGKKQTEFMSPEGIERTRATRFKKGQLGWNHKEVGYERISVDGYVEIKVAEPNKFKLKHRLVWEQHNGTIPKGFNVQFKDKNPQNVTIENLYLISRSEQMKKENSFHAKYPKDIQLAIHSKGALTRHINKKLKHENN